MSTEPRGAGWADSMRLSRRTLLRFLPRRLTLGQQATQDEIDEAVAASEPPETVTGGELRAHSPQNLGRFLDRLESNATLADSAASANSATRANPAAGTDPGKDDRGPEEEL